MNLQDYIAEAEKQYPLRLKSIVPLDDAAMDKVERCVDKYQPIDISKPVKTILQKQPLDFQNVENAEVYIVDMVFALPVAPHVLHNDIRKALKAPDSYIVVRGMNEPIEVESMRLDAIADIEAEAAKRGLTPASLLANPDYPELDTPPGGALYGNAYNSAFLSYLHDVQTSRTERRVNATNSLFNYLDLPDREDQEPVQSDADFNAPIKDAPPIVPATKVKGAKVSRRLQGEINGADAVVKRVYTDKAGKRVVLSRKLGGEK